MAKKGYKTPAELGFSQSIQQQFAQAGITELPEWMSRVSSDKRDLSDLVSTYVKFSDPNFDWKSVKDGKAEKILSGMGWTVGADGTPVKSTGGIPTTYMRPAGAGADSAPDDPSMNPANFISAYPEYQQGESWSDADKNFFLETLIRRKTEPNVGAWESSIKPALMGVGSIGSMIAAPYLLGAGAVAPAIEGGATGGGWLGALEGGMGAYGAGGAGAAGSLGSIAGGAGAIGTAGSTGITEAIAAGQAAGADVGMGAGTSWLTDLGLPASYGSGISGAGSYAGDSLTSLFGNGAVGTNSTTGSGLISSLFGDNWLSSLIGVGGAIGGGVMANNAIQDSIEEMQKYNKPFYDLGVSNIGALNAADPTGGAGQFIDQLKDYGTNFEFDYDNPAYTQQLAETTRLNDQNLAARGMYNSRAGLNLQDQSQRNLVTTEFDKQYSRGYTNLMDMFNMTSKNANTKYGKLLDMVKIGAGAAGTAGAGSLASGQSSADLYSGLGAMPMNYMILQNMLSGSK